MRGAVLLPEQLQRHALPPELAVDRWPVRLWPPRLDLGQRRRRREQLHLQRLVAQVVRQRPRQASPPCPADEVPAAVAPTLRLIAILRLDMPPALSRSTSRILRIGNLCPGMPSSSQKEPMPYRFEDHPTVPVTSVHSLVAIARKGWSRSIGTPGRNQLEQVVAITRCAQS